MQFLIINMFSLKPVCVIERLPAEKEFAHAHCTSVVASHTVIILHVTKVNGP